MKKITTIIFFVCASLALNAQTNNYLLDVTCNKTINLVFPASIISVDRGSRDILVQKAAGVENILRVKADIKDFPETSLSIITADGKLYSFVVEYCQQPAYLNIDVARMNQRDSSLIIYSAPGTNKSSLGICQDSIMSRRNNVRLHTQDARVSFSLNGLYVHEEVMFFKFALKNNSPINYDIEQLNFYVRDKVKGARTSSQEIELKPLALAGNTTVIHGNSKEQWVIGLQKFTIPDRKYLSIEIMEKNGGRNLVLKVRGNKIMKAKSI